MAATCRVRNRRALIICLLLPLIVNSRCYSRLTSPPRAAPSPLSDYYNRRDGTTTWEEPVHRAPDPRRSSVSLAARRSSMRRTSSMDFASASPRSRANTGLSRHGSIDEMVDEDDESGSSSDESSSGSGGESSSEGDDESGSSSSSSSSSDEGAPAAAAAAPAPSVFSSIAGQSPVERARARFEVTDAALVGRFGLSKKKKKKTKKKKHRSATGRQRIERARARHKQLDAERRGGGARARTVVIHASGSSSSSSRLKDKKKPTRLNGGARNSLFKRVMAGGSGAKPPPPTSAPPPRRISSFGGGAPPAPPAPSGFRRPSVSHAAIHEARLRASSRT